MSNYNDDDDDFKTDDYADDEYKIKELDNDTANDIVRQMKEAALKNQKKIGSVIIGQSSNVHDSMQIDPQLANIIEKVGIHRNMSIEEIEKLKKKLHDEPAMVTKTLKQYYDEKVEPVLKERQDKLKSEVAATKNSNAIVFMYINQLGRDEDTGKIRESEKVMKVDINNRPGFEIYHGQIVNQLRPDQTPFESPDVLFENKQDKQAKLKM